jgi:hypothetical protein
MLSQYYSIFTIWVVFTITLQKREIAIIKVNSLLLIIRIITQLFLKKKRLFHNFETASLLIIQDIKN